MRKENDISKYYKTRIKSAKDIEKYIENSKKLEILSVDIVGLVGNIYTEKTFKELQELFDEEIETTCKCMSIKIIDELAIHNEIITIYYNNYEDLITEKDYEGEYKQMIYKILY